MSNEEIIQGNKLIAEFMGCNPKHFKNKGGSGYDVNLNGVPEKGYMSYTLAEYGTKEFVINRLLQWPFYYHTSWDWLMPVVEKINKICREVGGELSNHSRDQKDLENPLDNPKHWKSWSYHNARLSTDIVYVYNGVVQFIKWKNNQP